MNILCVWEMTWHGSVYPFSFFHSHSPIQAFLQYPTMTSAKENRDYIVASMTEALTAIAELIDDKDPASIPFLQAVQQTSSNYGLYQYFEEFEVSVYPHMLVPLMNHNSSYTVVSYVFCLRACWSRPQVWRFLITLIIRADWKQCYRVSSLRRETFCLSLTLTTTDSTPSSR